MTGGRSPIANFSQKIPSYRGGRTFSGSGHCASERNSTMTAEESGPTWLAALNGLQQLIYKPHPLQSNCLSAANHVDAQTGRLRNCHEVLK